MLLISCIWCLALLCHLISLDMLCVNATCSVSNYHICELCIAILLQRHYICELCNAMLYSQSSCMWIISCYHFLYYVFHLSITFVYSTTLPVHQPFEAVMEVYGVKTRYSEQTMLPTEADILLVTESSSEEDSETDDQSYFPLRSMLKLDRVILPMSCMLSCIA